MRSYRQPKRYRFCICCHPPTGYCKKKLPFGKTLPKGRMRDDTSCQNRQLSPENKRRMMIRRKMSLPPEQPHPHPQSRELSEQELQPLPENKSISSTIHIRLLSSPHPNKAIFDPFSDVRLTAVLSGIPMGNIYITITQNKLPPCAVTPWYDGKGRIVTYNIIKGDNT